MKNTLQKYEKKSNFTISFYEILIILIFFKYSTIPFKHT